jgi:CBS domain-containing protein
MPLSSIARRKVVTAPPDASLDTIARLMEKHNVGSVVITEGSKPVGIVTDRDLVVRAVVKGRAAKDTHARDIMTRNLKVFRERDGICEALAEARKAGVRRLPIVDDEGNLTGIVSIDDLVFLIGKELGDIAEILRKEGPRL